MSRFCLLAVAALFALATPSHVQAQSLAFQIDKVYATGCGPLYYHPVANMTLCAYTDFDWGAESSSTCQVENIGDLDGCAGVTMTSDAYDLKSFTYYGSGDHRIYADGVVEVASAGAVQLRLHECRFSNSLAYDGPVILGDGWCTIDMAASNPSWVSDINPDGLNQVRIAYASFTQDVQDNVGFFHFTAQIWPASHTETTRFANLATSKRLATTADLPDADVSLTFDAYTLGGGADNSPNVYANRITTAPSGTPPVGVERIVPDQYWVLGTTVETFTATVDFDLSRLQSLLDPSGAQLLYRARDEDPWTVYTDAALVSSTTLRASNVTALGEWAIGAPAVALGVELSAFDVVAEGSAAVLRWATASETNNAGFSVESRRIDGPAANWIDHGFVAGRGTTEARQRYGYRVDGLAAGTYGFRLKQVDRDGTVAYSREVELAVGIPAGYALGAAYPNPFNPTTQFTLAVAVEQPVTVALYDVTGRRVATLFEGTLPAETSRTFRVDASGLPGGLYLIRASGARFTASQTITLLK